MCKENPDACGPGLLRAGTSGEDRCKPHHTVPVSPQCPQEIGLPTLPPTVLQGAVVSGERFFQSPPGNIAVLRGLLPLRRSLEQLVRSSPASPPLQGTELAALVTPEVSLERLISLVVYLAAWGLFPNVSQWVLHTVEMGYRIQFGCPCLVSRGSFTLWESGFYSWYFIVPEKDGGLRSFLDLHYLNRSVMQFLRFAFRGEAYQYWVPPFVVWDSTTMQAPLSPARIESILTAVAREGRLLSVKQLQKLLGLMAAASKAIPFGLLYMRALQW
ncbi:4-alpha-glucanotransferase [Labeo rohita]|uniref:4-alpha-glucanotransferase n=1 Tax=Labeo rohita TaxID=84645 RepID=A0ABQ8MMX5_LABRO|nr:4-alpha-glucanotransferase [Labeo rohita]